MRFKLAEPRQLLETRGGLERTEQPLPGTNAPCARVVAKAIRAAHRRFLCSGKSPMLDAGTGHC